MPGHSCSVENSNKISSVRYRRSKMVIFGRFLPKLATFRRLSRPSTFNLNLFNVDFRDQRIKSNLNSPEVLNISTKVDFVVSLVSKSYLMFS